MDRHIKALIAVVLILAVGLVGFFAFSAPYGDGLEVTMEHAGVEEKEPVYTAPLDYGDDYPHALLMGVLGMSITLGAVYGLGKLAGRKNDARKGD